jgi:Carboxypeptidase regulatory-like domain/TonB dependent receptor
MALTSTFTLCYLRYKCIRRVLKENGRCFLNCRQSEVCVWKPCGLVQLLAVVVVLLFISVSAFSQSGSSSIQGTLTDKSGGVVQGAIVTVLDVARGTNRVLTTDGAGQWVATNIIPGTYTVRAEAKGFSTIERTGVAVEVGQSIRVDLELQPGEQTQTVTVTEEVPFINAADAQLGGTVSNEAIQQLPLNGRNFQRLLQLHPGVVTTPGSGTGNGDFTNGRKQGDDLFRVEGISTIAQTANLSGVLNGAYRSGDSSSLLPLDSIQEFNTAQSPKAEDGWKEGSVVSIGIKSGTNGLHGTAFAFGRNANATDAANFFTGTVTDATLEQFGASAGGPVVKDKLFWFASYEGLRDVLHGNALVSVPASVSTGAGNSLVDTCKTLGAAKINTLSAQLVGLNPATCVVTPSSSTVENLYPFNTTGTFTPGLETTGPLNNGIFKADYVPGAKHHISGVFFRTRADQVVNTAAGQLLPQWRNGVIDRVDFSTVAWTWIPNSTWVNDLRWGLAYFNNATTVLDGNVNPSAPWPTGYGINTGVTNPAYFGMPFITITGFTSQLGIGNNEPTVRGPEGNWSIIDNVSYLRGKHSFKFGFEFIGVIWDEGLGGNVQAPYAGSVTFANLSSFLQGTPQRGTILVGDNTNNFRQHYYSGFAQDDWRLTSRLTLNLGLRYEFKGTPYEVNNYFGGFNPNVNPATTPAVQAVGPGAPIPQYYKNNWDEFSPRFGMAWDVRGDGKTVVRASASLMRDYSPLNTLIKNAPFGANYPDLGINTSGTVQNLKTVNSYSLQANQINWTQTGPVFPAAVSQTIGGVTYTGVTCTKASDAVTLVLPTGNKVVSGSPCTVTAIDPNFRYPRVAEWSLDVQRAIAKGLAIDVAYVGNYGWDETSGAQLNMPALGAGWTTAAINTCLASAPAYNKCTPDTTKEVGQYSTIFPYFNFITQNQSHSKSNYNALQVTVNQRAFHGLSFIAGYTYSHSLDNTPDGSPYNPANLSMYYGNGAADIRNRFSFSPTYQLPGIKSPAQMLKGWSVNAIVLMQGGTPWSPFDIVSTTEDIVGTGNGSGPAQYWNYSGAKSAFKTTFNPIPCYGGTVSGTGFQGCTAPGMSFLTPNAVPGVEAARQACLAAATAPYGGANSQLGQLAIASLTNFGCYTQNGGVLTPPAYGTTGDTSKGFFTGPVYYNVDFSVAKLWKIKERYSAQFRVEFFNLLNRVDLTPALTSTSPSSGSTGQFGCSCTTPDTGNRNLNPVLGSGGPRHIQFGLKLTF